MSFLRLSYVYSNQLVRLNQRQSPSALPLYKRVEMSIQACVAFDQQFDWKGSRPSVQDLDENYSRFSAPMETPKTAMESCQEDRWHAEKRWFAKFTAYTMDDGPCLKYLPKHAAENTQL
ncbi:prephenate dehydrogenase (NADP(+)) [Hypoxylon texense]